MTESEHIDWHVVWGDSELTMRLRSGSQLGEDESGEIGFRPSPLGCWIEFTIDEENALWVAPISNLHQLFDGKKIAVDRVRLEPGTQIELPNNRLHISTSMQRCTSSGVSVALTKFVRSDDESVEDTDYGQFPLFSDESGGEHPARPSTIEKSRPASLEDPGPVPLNRFKWFLIGPLLGFILLMALTIWNALESVMR